jgi:hypothetical protein
MKLLKNKLKIKRYQKVMRFANWLQQLPNKVTPAPFRLIQIGSAYWQSRVLYVATRLELADEIGDSEKSIATLSETLNLYEDHLYRLMRMLASMGVFVETSHRVFKNSKLSEYLRKSNPKNVRSMILMHQSPEMVTPWMETLEESIRDGGIPFKKANGKDLFEYMNENQSFDSLFSEAMDTVENLTGSQFLSDFNWAKFNRVIDVGGSTGSKSLAILKNNPGLRATVFDRKQIIQNAREKWQNVYDDSVLARIEYVGGDVFDAIPEAESNNDIYLFIAVFHSFNDNECIKILENLKIAMGDKSPYVVIIDTVASDINTSEMIASMDMQMLIGTEGRERTLPEWKYLFDKCDFSIKYILDTRTFAKYIVIRKQ